MITTNTVKIYGRLQIKIAAIQGIWRLSILFNKLVFLRLFFQNRLPTRVKGQCKIRSESNKDCVRASNLRSLRL